MADEKKPSIFTKILAATEAQLDQVIAKAKTKTGELVKNDGASFDLMPSKSVTKDPSYAMGVQGYQEKTARLSYLYLKQMAYKDSIVAAVIQTRQNQVAAFSKPVKQKFERGFKVVLKDEEAYLEKLEEEIYGAAEQASPEHAQMEPEEFLLDEPEKDPNAPEPEPSLEEYLLDAPKEEPAPEQPSDPSDPEQQSDSPADLDDPYNAEEDPTVQLEQEQETKEFLEKQRKDHLRLEMQRRIKAETKRITDFISSCGEKEGRPFDNEKWDFDAYLRATVRDSLSYDQFATEKVRAELTGELHHFFPMDGSTIRQATPQLKSYNNYDVPQLAGYDILYPEKELEAMERKETLELDPAKLKNDEYVWVQILNGRVVRAYTKDELSVGMRNPQTDIYANGYSISELELLLSVVTQHIFAENYNKSYYTNGFSAKGILHIKANLPRRKLESFRVMWNHMIKGNRNSFQTPILAGMEEIQWIPLTQAHSDIEFSEYINYLIKLICSIFQIDPSEIGFGMQEEGGSGGGMAGDNTEVKIKQSKDKGLAPFLRYLENYINKTIVDELNPDFKMEFVGIHDENQMESVNRQKEEVRFKKSVNEVRAEDGLPPIPGCDALILDPIYFQFFSNIHPEGKIIGDNKKEEARQRMIENGLVDEGASEEKDFGDKGRSESQDEGLRDRGRPEKDFKKSLNKKKLVSIEYYKINE